MGKKGVILGGIGGIMAIGYAVYCVVNKKNDPNPLAKYNMDYIRGLSDQDWEIEREIVRKDFFCNPNIEMKVKEYAHLVLGWFDKVKREKNPVGKVKIPYHREHGFNLYKPD